MIRWAPEPGGVLVRTHGSGDLRNFAEGSALALLPPNRASFSAGEAVEVLLDAQSVGG